MGREDPLKEGLATHSSILPQKNPWTEEPGRLHIVHGVTESDMTEATQVHTCVKNRHKYNVEYITHTKHKYIKIKF